MSRIVTFSVILLAMCLSVGCASARRSAPAAEDATQPAGPEMGERKEGAVEDVEERTGDGTITAEVRMKLAADRTIDASKINVETKENLVTLTGTVHSKVAADKAVALAKRVEGVNGVVAQLTLKHP